MSEERKEEEEVVYSDPHYQAEKLAKVERKHKLRMLELMKANLNIKLAKMNPEDENFEAEFADVLSDLQDVEVHMAQFKRNKRRSKFYKWIPSIGLNRRQRRSK